MKWFRHVFFQDNNGINKKQKHVDDASKKNRRLKRKWIEKVGIGMNMRNLLKNLSDFS